MVKKLPVAINEEEFAKLILATTQEHHKVAFLLGYGSGLRVSEIVKLKKEDINFNEGTIFIHQGKGGKDRIVPKPEDFKPKHLEFIPMKCGVRSLEYAFRNALESSKLVLTKPDAHFHSLRHGFASQCVKNGMPIHHVRTLMGHTNISTTNVYLELNPKEAISKYRELFK